MRYKTKPFEIEAKKYEHTMRGFSDMQKWCGYREVDSGYLLPYFDNAANWILDAGPHIAAAVYDKLHETWVGVHDGDYIIRGSKGELYPCQPDVFEAKYEPVNDDPRNNR